MPINPNEIPVHIELIIAVIVPVVSITTSIVVVWAALKYGLKEVIKDLKTVSADVLELSALVAQKADEKIVADLKKDIKEKADAVLMRTLVDEVDAISKELREKVPFSTCGTERRECHQDRITLNCEMSKQITLLVSAMNSQDDKRQLQGEKNSEMLMKIMEKIQQVELSVSQEISKMQKLILERSSRFRKPTEDDLVE